MTKDIIETAITIDHETGDVYVDTRSRAFASMCRRAGLMDTTKTNSAPYTRFRGTLDMVDLIVRKHRSSAGPSHDVRERGLASIQRLSSQPKTGQKDAQEDRGIPKG